MALYLVERRKGKVWMYGSIVLCVALMAYLVTRCCTRRAGLSGRLVAREQKPLCRADLHIHQRKSNYPDANMLST